MKVAAILVASAALMVGAAQAKDSNVAAAHCRITGVTGHGTSGKSIADALQKAISDCVAQGGISACCRTGAYAVSPTR